MTYKGGKNADGTYHTIINQMPPHEVYIEPFLGSGAIIRNKKPAKYNYGYELNESVIKQFHNNAPYKVMRKNGIVAIKNHLQSTSTLIYADPPYLFSSRRNQRSLYNTYEWRISDHEKFLDMVIHSNCMMIISAYEHSMYNDALKDWRKIIYTVGIHGGRTAQECLYMNYEEPTELHQYDYLGKDFIDRGRIKRRITLLTNKLKALPAQERNAVLSAVYTNMYLQPGKQ